MPSMSAVLDFLQEIYGQHDASGFVRSVLEWLPRLIAADMASFNEVDPRTGHYRTVVAPAGADRFPGSGEIFERHVRAHPYIVNVKRFEDGGAHALSEFVGRADFRRSAIYNEYYRRTGTESQLAIALPWGDPWVRGIALNRGRRDFSARERRLLTALGPHMLQAYRNAEALALAREAGTAADARRADVEVVLLSGAAAIQFATPRARRWLATYFGGSGARDGRLPTAITDWVRVQQSTGENGDGVPPVRRPLIAIRGERDSRSGSPSAVRGPCSSASAAPGCRQRLWRSSGSVPARPRCWRGWRRARRTARSASSWAHDRARWPSTWSGSSASWAWRRARRRPPPSCSAPRPERIGRGAAGGQRAGVLTSTTSEPASSTCTA